MKTETTNTNKEANKKASFDIVSHDPFPTNMKSNFVSSIEMADIVSSIFGSGFSDFHGCNVRINDGSDARLNTVVPIGGIYVDLFFKDHGAATTGIKNLERIGAPATSDSGEVKPGSVSYGAYKRYQNVTSAAGKTYNVTKDTFESLEKFAFGNGHNRNINWWTEEFSAPMTAIGTKEEAIVCIHGLSLKNILTELYGVKDEEGSYEYEITPSTFIPYRGKEFVMQVSQLELNTVRKLRNILGAAPSNYTCHVWNC